MALADQCVAPRRGSGWPCHEVGGILGRHAQRRIPPMNRRRFLVGSGLTVAATVFRGRPAARAAVADLDFASAGEIARAIRLGEVSSVEVTRHTLQRIERYNPRLNAIVTVTADAALERARAADE